MRVLVTGATGFIGTRLLDAFRTLGHEAWGLTRYVTGRVRTDRLVFADLRDPLAVRDAVRAVRPEVVFHLGAMTPVALSFDRPLEYGETNYLGTVSLAEACARQEGFRLFVFASTSETYGIHPEVDFPLNEGCGASGSSPYAVSKIAAEEYLKYLWLAHEFPFVSVRPFNTYGRTDTHHFVVENTVAQMLLGGPVVLGNPDTVRDYLWVEDHIEGYLRVFQAFAEERTQIPPLAVNLCTGKGWATRDVAGLAADATGWEGEVRWNAQPRRPVDIPKLVGSNRIAEGVLGWRHNVRLEEGIERVVAHWRTKVKKIASA